MSLPDDKSRCTGHALDNPTEVCSRRDACARFIAPRPERAWFLPPQVPGPCVYYLPADGPGAERPEQSPQPKDQ